MNEKRNDEESKFFQVLQRVPAEPERDVCLKAGSEPYQEQGCPEYGDAERDGWRRTEDGF